MGPQGSQIESKIEFITRSLEGQEMFAQKLNTSGA